MAAGPKTGDGDGRLQARVHPGAETKLEPIRARLWFSVCHAEIIRYINGTEPQRSALGGP